MPAVPPGAAPLVRSTVRDAADRVFGGFRFAVDRRVEGEAYAVCVRSTLPHGILRGVDSTEALRAPGVLAVVTGEDVQRDPSLHPYHGEGRKDQPIIAIDRVRYVGEPVAVVVATTQAAAAEAATRVMVDVEPLAAVFESWEAATPGAASLHEQWPDNECGRWTLRHGDADAALRTAAFRHTGTYRSPAANHVAMEPHCSTAAWLPDGRLEVWSATQSPYALRERLAGIFGMSEERVRVRTDNLGGGFGGKLYLVIEGLVALAARVVGRPVRMELRRDEEFVTTGKHAAVVTITTGADAEGVMVARLVDIEWNAGAYALTTPRGSRSGLIRSIGPYKVPNVLARSVAWYTNTVPTGPFRGAMTGQVCWAHEQAADEIAAMVGLDPIEFRRRNLLCDGDMFATGEVMHDMRYVELLESAWAGLPPDDGNGKGHGLRVLGRTDGTIPGHVPGGRIRGRGAAVVLKSIITPSRSDAFVTLDADGLVTVRVTAVEMGQGAAASVAELTARQLHVPIEHVKVAFADTDHTPYDKVTSSSRTTYTVGIAVERGCQDLCRQLEELHRSGPRGSAASFTIDWSSVLRARGIGELTGTGVFESPPGAGELDADTQGIATDHWHQGAVAVEVEVDTDTGRVEVLAVHGASYAGRIVDPLRAKKQTEGGMLFGLGTAVLEEMRYDQGQPATTNLSDYQIPSIMDIPTVIGSTVLESGVPDTPPHGLGENTVPPMAPAIGNALAAATGIRIHDLPITAEKVLRALREREGEAS
ncbi:MAG: xanthine dehydrogenase family protein molybdopterin-binding subunit [Acidimicrobiales bacterium]